MIFMVATKKLVDGVDKPRTLCYNGYARKGKSPIEIKIKKNEKGVDKTKNL